MKNTFKEVLYSVVPMTVLILILCLLFAPLSPELFISFTTGAGMMILGMTFFLFGADIAMMVVGHEVGKFMVKRRSLPIVIFLGFLIGWVITIAEPDVQVLANQVYGVSDGAIGKYFLTGVIAIGVGIFVVLALLRILLNWSYYHLMLIGYSCIFITALFTNPIFVPIAFDAGGVTTGPITVPFILSLATGTTSMLSSIRGNNANFGMVGLASLGPILAVMIMGVFV